MTDPNSPYEWLAPSGIPVVSVVPPVPYVWWDNPKYHIVWSYASWTTLLLAQAGTLATECHIPFAGKALKFPRTFLKGKGWW